MKNLKIKDYKISVRVKTLTGEKTHTSFAVDWLKVSRTLGLDAEWINIPKAYTEDHQIAMQEKIKE